MGTISSGVGLISGLDINTLVNQLLALDARPRDRLIARIGGLDAQRAAFADISARITGVISRLTSLKSATAFTTARATSSDSGVLSVSGGSAAALGSYQFVVRSLATTQQMVSRGFSSTTTALPPGNLTIESSAARVTPSTRLDELNGYAGVRRGSFRLTDGTNQSATIQINDAITLREVVDRINQAGLKITAQVSGDRIALREMNGGSLKIEEVAGGSTAKDLGFGPGNTFHSKGTLDGASLVMLSGTTPLRALNDGNGLRTAKGGGDFTVNGQVVDLSGNLTESTRLARLNHGAGASLGTIRITTTDGSGPGVEKEIDLSGLQTMGQVRAAILNLAPELSVTLASGRIVVGFASGGETKTLKIEDVSGNAARDLGIDGTSSGGKISGRNVFTMDRMSDVIAAIQHGDQSDGSLTATLVGAQLRIQSTSGSVTLAPVGSSTVLRDLGLAATTYQGPATTGRLLAGLDSVLLRSLNGGAGYTLGTVRIGAGAGSVDVHLSDAQSLSEVLRRIQSAADQANLGIVAEHDPSGTRIVVRSADGLAPVTMSDVSGDFAAKTGLAQASGASLRSDNLQRRYMNENTRLETLNQGQGVKFGKMKLTDSAGVSRTIELASSSTRTLADVIDAINTAGVGISARINDTGDGLLLTDTAGGAGTMQVEEAGGTLARDLNLLGTATGGRLDGTFELQISMSGGETLDSLVAKVNQKTGLARAMILNDGSGVNPFRLSLTSTATGSAGEVLIEGLGFDFTTLNRAQDARVLLGGAESGVLISSATNTLTGLIPGATLTLHAPSESTVTVSVADDPSGLISSMTGFVDAFNGILSRVKELTKYDSETQQRGLLLGDSTISALENRLLRLVSGAVSGAPGGIERLSELGFRTNNGVLELDTEKLKTALHERRDAVVEFFTRVESGFAVAAEKALKDATDATGLLGRRTETIGKQRELLSRRVGELNVLLELKRQRLTTQFNAMEQTLARLQSQQNALGQLSAIASSKK